MKREINLKGINQVAEEIDALMVELEGADVFEKEIIQLEIQQKTQLKSKIADMLDIQRALF